MSLLESERGRKKLLEGFYHCNDLDSRFAKPLPSNHQSAQAIEQLLKSKGAPATCYVVSADASLDNREMSLCEALMETVGGAGGTLISCIAGKLAYFELEPPVNKNDAKRVKADLIGPLMPCFWLRGEPLKRIVRRFS